MTPTKEELDEAIDVLWKQIPLTLEVERTTLTILTKYRDGELVEKGNAEKRIESAIEFFERYEHRDKILGAHLRRVIEILSPPNPLPTN